MKFYKIQMLGRFISEYVADVSALSYNASLDKGRILYDETTDTLYFGDDSGIGQFSPMGGASIPSTKIILFEHDTAVDGYNLLTSIDDETVYITKGSGAGGATGGAQKGTWTQPGHTHTGPSHTHAVGSHTHPFSATTSIESCYGANACSGGDNSHDHTVSGTTSASTGNTGSDGTGATSSSATADTWRPLGRNYTRQEKI